MDETNALSEDSLTPEGAEEETKTTDSRTEGETSPDKGTEPPDGAKSWEHALQRERERIKTERAAREQLEKKLEETNSRLREFELSGLDETERLRLEADNAKRETEELRQQIEVETVKKEYRAFLAEKERDFPKAVTFLRRQAERDIYPVQGRDRDEFDSNFEEFASEFEGTMLPKPTSTNPAYQPPAEVDYNSLSAAELRKFLPIKEEN